MPPDRPLEEMLRIFRAPPRQRVRWRTAVSKAPVIPSGPPLLHPDDIQAVARAIGFASTAQTDEFAPEMVDTFRTVTATLARASSRATWVPFSHNELALLRLVLLSLQPVEASEINQPNAVVPFPLSDKQIRNLTNIIARISHE